MKRLATVLCSFAALVTGQTYSKDVAPILLQSCAPCHRPGEAAPFSLLDYSDAKSHARQIADVTKARVMPPWKPAPGRGEFEGERRLTREQVDLIARWVARGAPEGDPADLPSKPKFSDGWSLGQPDLVITLAETYMLAASGTDVFRNFVLAAPVDRRRYVRAVEIRPGLKTVVHHANVLIDRQRTLRRRDRKDGEPGFPGMDVQIESRTFEPESHFLFWKPGTTVLEEPAGMAWQLDPGTDLILNMHLRPSGKPEAIQPSIGLYFTDAAPNKRPMLLQMEHDGAINIPPGQRDFTVTDTLEVPVNVQVLAVYPHGHYVARDMQAFATLPDGSIRWLIHIPDWDLNWQAVYRYKKPLSLPQGSKITMRYTYDNSELNPRNPTHPPTRVLAGDRSIDEMAHLWLQVLPEPNLAGESHRMLQKASMIRRLQKYPSDFEAHFSLGSLLQEEGNLTAAATHYDAALRTNPRSATALNALGSVFLEQGRVGDATSKFETAIGFHADYPDAHYNLARVLLSGNKIDAAITHLQYVIRADPDDAAALSDLGAALSMTGRVEEGLQYLRKAVERKPDYFLGRYNLGQALAAAGSVSDARSEFEAALRLKPNDQDVLEALARLRPGP